MTATIDHVDTQTIGSDDGDDAVNIPTDEVREEILAEAAASKALLTQDPVWADLLRPFPRKDIGLMPTDGDRDGVKANCVRGSNASRDRRYCGGYHTPSNHIDFIGHAAIEKRLIEVVGPDGYTLTAADPDVHLATIEAYGRAGLQDEARAYIRTAPPKIDAFGGCNLVLNVLGEERIGYGWARGTFMKPGDKVKAARSDAFRNAAMRLGLGIDLWLSKDVSALNGVARAVEDGPTADPNVIRRVILAAMGDDDPAETIRQYRQHDREAGVSWTGVRVRNEFGMAEDAETWAGRVRMGVRVGQVIQDWSDVDRGPSQAPPVQVSSRVRNTEQAATKAPSTVPAATTVAAVEAGPAAPGLTLTALDSWYSEYEWQSEILGEPGLRRAARFLQLDNVAKVSDLPPSRLQQIVVRSRRKVTEAIDLGVLTAVYLAATGPARTGLA